VLQQLIEVATKGEVDAVRNLWIRIVTNWVIDACSDYTSTEFASVSNVSWDATMVECGVSTVSSIMVPSANAYTTAVAGALPPGGPLGLLDMMMDMLQRAREVARMELHHGTLFYMASDYAFMAALSLLPRQTLDQLLLALAVALSRMMDPFCDDECLTGRAAVVAKERLIDFIQVQTDFARTSVAFEPILTCIFQCIISVRLTY